MKKATPGEVFVGIAAGAMVLAVGTAILKSGDGFDHSGDRNRTAHVNHDAQNQPKTMTDFQRAHQKAQNQPGR